MTGKDYIILDGISSEEVGLYVDTPPLPPMALRKYSMFETEELGQSLTLGHDFFEDITLTISCFVFDYGKNIDINAVYAWLRGKQKLQTSIYNDWYYYIKQIPAVLPSYSGKGLYKLDISFVCSPYRYNVNNNVITVERPETMIEVGGSYYARPIYKIYGTGEITLIVNDDIMHALTIYDVSEYVVVDCEKMMVHKDGVWQKNKGILPFFDVGTNVVNFTGNVEKIEITKNERWV